MTNDADLQPAVAAEFQARPACSTRPPMRSGTRHRCARGGGSAR